MEEKSDLGRKTGYKFILYPILSLFIYFLSEEISYGLYRFVLGMRGLDITRIDDLIMDNYYLIDSMAMVFAFIFLSVLIYIRSKDYKNLYGEDYLFTNNKLRGEDWKKSIIILMGTKGIINIWFLILDYIGEKSVFISNMMSIFETGAGSSEYNEPYVYLLVSIVILGPVVEELVFRGVFFRELLKFKNRNIALLISSLSFALFHGDFIQITYTFLMGLVLAYVYDNYRSISLVVFLHMVNNLLETLPPFLEDNYILGLVIYMAGFLSIIPGIVIIYRLETEKLSGV